MYPSQGIPSGGNPAGVLLQIRETIWLSDHWLGRKKAIKQKIYRQLNKKEHSFSSLDIENQTIRNLNEEKETTEVPDVIASYFYPKFWLPFTYFGKPCEFIAGSNIANLPEYKSFRPTSSKQKRKEVEERVDILRNNLLNIGKPARRFGNNNNNNEISVNADVNENGEDESEEDNTQQSPSRQKVIYLYTIYSE